MYFDAVLSNNNPRKDTKGVNRSCKSDNTIPKRQKGQKDKQRSTKHYSNN